MSPLVRSASFIKFSELAPGVGLDPLRAVRQVGLDQSCLLAPDHRVPETSLAAMLEMSARSGAHAAPGLLIGQAWRLADFGVISVLLQQQPTLHAMVAQLQRYRHLISDSVLLDVIDNGDAALIELRLLTARGDPGRHAMELALAVLLSLCRTVLGARWLPRSVHFSHAAPPSVREHQAVFGPQLEFSAGLDAIVLSHGDLHRSNPAGDAALSHYAEELLDRLPRPEAAAGSFTHEVRRALHLLLPRGEHGIEPISRRLGTSARTLQRQLERSGATFQGLLDDARRELALRYLDQRGYSVSQIAALLGFAETSAFSRWFAQQFGQAPSRWRGLPAEERPDP